MFYKGGKMAVASSNTDLHGYGEAIRRELARRVPRGRGVKVLDVGTGFGINLAFLARRVPKGSEIWTVDPSREVLRDVEAGLEGGAKVNFVEASADDLDFPDGFFDLVVSVMVLHHLEELEPALRELARVLRPGGRMVLVDYKPEASRELEFRTLHEAKDFFRPAAVARAAGRHGVEAVPRDFGLWYLVDARKPRATRAGARRARARAR